MATPFFTSHTPIAQMDTRLAGSIGDRLGAGIRQGVQAFMAGVEQKRMKDEKKAQDEAALQFAIKAAPMLGLDPNDTDALKAGIKGMGGGAEFLKFAQNAQSELAQAQYTQALTQRLMAQQKEEEEAKGKLSDIWAASKTATEDGNSEVDFESFMIGANDAGISAERALQFAGPMLPPKQREKPYVIDVGDEKFLIHGNNTPLKLGPGVDKLNDAQKAQISALNSEINKLQSTLLDLESGNLGYNPDMLNKDTTDGFKKRLAELTSKRNAILGIREPEPAVSDVPPPEPPPERPKGLPTNFVWNPEKKRWQAGE